MVRDAPGRGARPGAGADRDRGSIRTTGDRIQDRPLSEVGGKGLFTKEIEEALAAGDDRSRGAFGQGHADGAAGRASSSRRSCRARTRATCSSAARRSRSRDLPRGAVVGTASLRRQALVKRLRPDLAVVPLRGNVETRLRKLDEGVVDATLLALAGLKRLGLADAATAMLDVDEFLPAVGQGAIAHRGARGRRGDARSARRDRSCRQHDRAAGRARVPRGARRLVPHADRRPCDDCERPRAASAA